jgi:casein kinase 1 gamma
VVSSTNGELPGDDPAGGQSMEPIQPPTEVEVVDETKCCFFRRRKKKKTRTT